MSVKIIAPDGDSPVMTFNGVFVACGRADDKVLGVTGTCQSTKVASRTVTGVPLLYEHHLKSKAAQRFRWLLMFKVPAPDEYTLTVVGRDHAGTKPSNSLTITTQEAPKPPKPAPAPTTGVLVNPFITIVSPGDDPTDISDQKDDFTPYGDLPDAPLASVTLQQLDDDENPVGDPIIPPYSYGDYTELFYWVAQFDPIEPDTFPTTYTLTVTDTNNNTATRNVVISS